MMKKYLIMALVAALAVPQSAQADIVDDGGSEAASFTVSNTDLLQTAFASHNGSDLNNRTGNASDTSFLQSFTPNGEASLRDGVWQDVGVTGAGAPFGRSAALVESGEFIEWSFDLTTNTSGYDVTQIDLYSNWGTGQGRDEINAEISFSFVGSPGTFVSTFTPAVYDPPNETQGRVSITEDMTGIIATGVAAVRFDFPDQENSAVGYSEIDVFGTATVAVPEPSSLAAFLVGGLGMMTRRRKRNA